MRRTISLDGTVPFYYRRLSVQSQVSVSSVWQVDLYNIHHHSELTKQQYATALQWLKKKLQYKSRFFLFFTTRGHFMQNKRALNFYKYHKSVKYDRLGECSPEKDCLWWHWRFYNLTGSHLTVMTTSAQVVETSVNVTTKIKKDQDQLYLDTWH